MGKRIVNTKHDLRNKWDGIRFGEVSIDYVEGGFQYNISVSLNNMNPDTILIQLFADGLNGGIPEILKMERDSEPKEEAHRYHAHITTSRPASDYTVRIISNYEGISVPLEDNLIRWQH